MAEIVSEKLVLGGVNMTVRERTQETESRILSPFAALSSKSRGRRRPEEEDELRTVFSVTEIASFTVNPFAASSIKRMFFFRRRGTITVPG